MATSSASSQPASRAVLAAGTAAYDSAHFPALGRVPGSLSSVVAALSALGFATVAADPGYCLDLSVSDLRSTLRGAASTAPVVVVYYTGHGTFLELDGFYLVGRASQPADFSGTALAAAELPRLLVHRDSAGEPLEHQPRILIILDCCFSGQAGMELLGQALRGVGNPHLWVIASAGPVEYAQQGKFAEAFCDALEHPVTGPSAQFLSLEAVVQVINDAWAGDSEQQARVFLPPQGSTGLPPFFPNKHYKPGLAGLTVIDQQHWLSRARAAPAESTTGFYLAGRTGRVRAMEDLLGWLSGSAGPGGLAVVTGSPGTGKSALLSVPVLLSQPATRADLLAHAAAGSLTERAAALLPRRLPVAAVHARGLNADQAAESIARSLGLQAGSVATLLRDLTASPPRRAAVIIDALDEAEAPQDLLADLLLPLGEVKGLRIAVGGRRHVMHSFAQVTIDLDDSRYHDPEALTGYVRELLTATQEPGIRTPYQNTAPSVTDAVAAAIAERATSSDGRAESFLIGRTLALSVRSRPEPVDTTGIDWRDTLPAELTSAFKEDLARLGDRAPIATALLRALAWAEGSGLPWENVWVPVARALADPGSERITNDDVRWLLEHAGAYIVEDVGSGQRSVYRPFHELLAAYLRGEQAPGARDGAEDRGIQKLITDALIETVPVGADGRRQWALAHPYVTAYLARHAQAADSETVTNLVRDPRFLAATDRATFSPYRGLLPYTAGEAALFFGRERETASVVSRLAGLLGRPSLFAVAGVSGVGKSSLLGAGLIPALRAGALPGTGAEAWPVLMFPPTAQPLTELALRVAAVAELSPAEVLQSLRENPAAVSALLVRGATRSWPSAADDDGTVRPTAQPGALLIIDQFEQIFTLVPDEDERQAFITALHAFATVVPPGSDRPAAIVVLGIRADFESRCAEYPELIEAIQDRYLVLPMTERQLRLAITEPARTAGAEVEADLVESLLRELAPSDDPTRPGLTALPQLSYALDQTWRGRSGENLTLSDYERTGGIAGSLATTAEAAYGRLSLDQRDIARQLFLRLVTVTEDSAARATVSRGELNALAPPSLSGDLKFVVNLLADARLLVLSDAAVTISHEVLLSAWPRLRSWIDEFYAGLMVFRQIRDAASDWQYSSRDPSLLFRGTRLAVATEVMGETALRRSLAITPGEQAFIDASLQHRRRSLRARRTILAAMAVLIVALVTETVMLLSLSH